LLERFLTGAQSGSVWQPGLVVLYTEVGRYEAARNEFEKLSADDFAAVPRDGLWVTCLAYLAEVCAVLDDAERAKYLYRHLLPYSGQNVVAGTSVACFGAADRFLGLLAMTAGDQDSAVSHLVAALALDRRTGARPSLAHGQYQLAALRLAADPVNSRAAAASLLEEAAATAGELGMGTLSAKVDRLSNQNRLSTEESANPDGLSRRELDVVQLLATGHSNREIATRLFVSPNTVANHVRSILAKTNTSNRTQAAAYARRCNLIEG
ncbi:helix-turn-helix transcriptional regulator, partial [Salinisphaera orenii]|uniref:helix-turn-helix transcriptional regulator n=1 Tax=Salinisphaera orenii TaxID=856731 RepID=UPI001C83E242